ncbi:MAG: right-handed parallel beta-helix repeat-containing protein [Pseudomonadota bacterium]
MAIALIVACLCCFGSQLAAQQVSADNVFFVDPRTGSDEADGKQSRPWKSISHALKQTEKIHEASQVVLQAGMYADVLISNLKPKKQIVVKAAGANKAQLTSLKVTNSARLRFEGLHIWREVGEEKTVGTLVHFDTNSEAIAIVASKVETRPIGGTWTLDHWKANRISGIEAGGKTIRIEDNSISNIRFGIAIGADHSLVLNNTISHFSGDGIRGLGNYSTYQGNTIKNCISIDGTHRDGFQSWSVGTDGKVGSGKVIGVKLVANKILETIPGENSFPCKMQGIGLFDGMYVDWRIENNVVVADHWHGITVYGGERVLILHNTVYDPNPRKPGPSRIMIGRHKDGRDPLASWVINNIGHKFQKTGTGVFVAGNSHIRDPRQLFIDPANLDLRLRRGSLAINAGVTRAYVGRDLPRLPSKDIAGQPRRTGKWYDAGAYEYIK